MNAKLGRGQKLPCLLPMLLWSFYLLAAHADAAEPRITYCDTGFVGPFGQQRAPVNATVEINIAHWHELKSIDIVTSMLNLGYMAAAEYCRANHPTNPLGDVGASINISGRVIISARRIA